MNNNTTDRIEIFKLHLNNIGIEIDFTVMKITFLAENMITPGRRTRYITLKSGKCILRTGQRYVI